MGQFFILIFSWAYTLLMRTMNFLFRINSWSQKRFYIGLPLPLCPSNPLLYVLLFSCLCTVCTTVQQASSIKIATIPISHGHVTLELLLPQSTVLVEMKQGECVFPLSRSVHCNFVRDGNRLKGGGRAPPTLTSQDWFFHHDGMYARNRQSPLCVYSEVITSKGSFTLPQYCSVKWCHL